MKRYLYYIAPSILVPLSMLICEYLDNTNLIHMSPYIFIIVLCLISVVMGNLSSTHKNFDYIMTIIMPLSLFCTMFVGAFLGKSDLETRFHFNRAFDAAFQPLSLIIYFIMAATTFFASFKAIRIMKRLKSH